MQNQWRNAAIEAAGACLNGPGYGGNGANARTSASAPRLAFPDSAWVHHVRFNRRSGRHDTQDRSRG